MASPTVTYTFTNGTSADAGQVNTNFTDVINAMTSGTDDFSISALTVAGTATLNGDCTFGNGSTDDLTFTGSLSSSVPVKTADTYDIGTAALPLRDVYVGDNGFSVGIGADASASADWNFSFPPASGTKGHGLQASASGAHVYAPMQTDINILGDDAYPITDTDGYRHILIGSSADMTAPRTVTLPTAADNTDRTITIKKMDSADFDVTVDGEGAETIDGVATKLLSSQYESLTLVCDGTSWYQVNRIAIPISEIECRGGLGYGSSATTIREFTNTPTINTGNDITATIDSTNGAKFTINRDGIYSITYTDGFSGASFHGLSLNSTQTTTAISSMTDTDRLCMNYTTGANLHNTVSWTGKLSATDFIHPHCNGTTEGANAAKVVFRITQLVKL